MKRITASIVLALALILTGAGCRSTGGEASREGNAVMGHGAAAIPDTTLTDWVTYSDQLVVWTATDEVRGEVDPDDKAVDEGLIPRLVTVKTDKIVWSRPGLASELKKGPGELQIANGGWVFHGSDEKPFLMDDQTQMEVGQQYVAVVSYADLSLFGSSTPRPDADGPEWIGMDWFKLDNGVIDPKAALGDPKGLPARAAIAGLTTTAAATVLSATTIDPKAKPYMDLDPMLRVRKVQDQVFATTEPKPGPGPGETE